MRYFLTLFLCACAFDPTGVPMETPAIYRQWYSEVEACSGLTGNFDRVRWQHAPEIRQGTSRYYGYWYPKHTITIRDDSALNEKIVKHEEMHDLLQSGDHPALYFTQLCGNLIGP